MHRLSINKSRGEEVKMSRKIALCAFNGELMCFAHVLLNAEEMKSGGYDVKLIIEGTATGLIQELENGEKPFAKLYDRVKKMGIIDCVCQACAAKTGSLESAKTQKLPLCSEMSGHPSISKYIEDGYEILIF